MTTPLGVMEVPAPVEGDSIRRYETGTLPDGGLWTALRRLSDHDHTGGLNGTPISVSGIPDGSITIEKLDPDIFLPYALVDGSKPFTGMVTMEADATVRDTLYFGEQGTALPPDVSLTRGARPGTLVLTTPGGNVDWFAAKHRSGGTGVARFGQAATATQALVGFNADYDGTNWVRDDNASRMWLLALSSAGADVLSNPAGTSGMLTWTTEMHIGGGGVEFNGPVTSSGTVAQERSLKFNTDYRARWQFGVGGGTVESGGNAGSDLGLYFYSDAGAYLGQVYSVRRSDGMTVYTTGVDFTGGLFLGPVGAAACSLINQEGAYLTFRKQTNSFMMMLIDGDAGNLSVTGVVSAGAHVSVGNGNIYGPGTAALSLYAQAGMNIQLNPSGGFVHPDAHAIRVLGHPGLMWYETHTNIVHSATDLHLRGDSRVIASPTNNPTTYFENSANGTWPGIGDGVITLGRAGARWTSVWAANGTIQTCLTSEKRDFRSLDPEEALLAILRTPIQTYRSAPTPGRRAAADRWPEQYAEERDRLFGFRFVGFRAEAVDPLFLLDGDKHVSAQHTASIAVSGIQALYNRLAKLEARIKELTK